MQFGETTALTLSTEAFQDWVDAAFLTLYNDLPSTELRNLVEEDTVSLVAGEGVIPDTWDRLLDARDSGVPLKAVAPDVLANIDTNRFYEPTQPVWTSLGKTIFVRPDTLGSITVIHQDPPPGVVWATDGDVEYALVPSKWHTAVTHLVTSFAYQQEEDHNAAAHWRNRYAATVGGPQEALSAEEEQA